MPYITLGGSRYPNEIKTRYDESKNVVNLGNEPVS